MITRSDRKRAIFNSGVTGIGACLRQGQRSNAALYQAGDTAVLAGNQTGGEVRDAARILLITCNIKGHRCRGTDVGFNDSISTAEGRLQEVRIRYNHVGNDSVVVNLLPRITTDVTELVRKPRCQDVTLQAWHSVTASEEQYRSGHAPVCAEIPARERGVRQGSATPRKTVWS